MSRRSLAVPSPTSRLLRQPSSPCSPVPSTLAPTLEAHRPASLSRPRGQAGRAPGAGFRLRPAGHGPAVGTGIADGSAAGPRSKAPASAPRPAPPAGTATGASSSLDAPVPRGARRVCAPLCAVRVRACVSARACVCARECRPGGPGGTAPCGHGRGGAPGPASGDAGTLRCSFPAPPGAETQVPAATRGPCPVPSPGERPTPPPPPQTPAARSAASDPARAGDLEYTDPPVSRASPRPSEPPAVRPAPRGWRAPRLRPPRLRRSPAPSPAPSPLPRGPPAGVRRVCARGRSRRSERWGRSRGKSPVRIPGGRTGRAGEGTPLLGSQPSGGKCAQSAERVRGFPGGQGRPPRSPRGSCPGEGERGQSCPGSATSRVRSPRTPHGPGQPPGSPACPLGTHREP